MISDHLHAPDAAGSSPLCLADAEGAYLVDDIDYVDCNACLRILGCTAGIDDDVLAVPQ